jgi:hypothetical protein
MGKNRVFLSTATPLLRGDSQVPARLCAGFGGVLSFKRKQLKTIFIEKEEDVSLRY